MSKAKWVLVVLLFVAVLLLWWLVPRWLKDNDYAATGTLFSGFAFAALIVAVMLQREELILQRKELKDTREVLDSQRQQLEEQKRQMEIQNFENRFFQMMKAWDGVLQSATAKGRPAGRETFKYVANHVQSYYDHEKSGKGTDSEEAIIDKSIIVMYRGEVGAVTNYMRTLYNIIKMIDRSQLNKEDKKFYSNIIRAQLSQYELVLIFYNCLSRYGREKFKPLIEKYALLKHLDVTGLIKPEHCQLYSENAFQ